MFKDGIQMRNVLFGVKLIDHKWEKAIEKGIFRNKYQSRQVFISFFCDCWLGLKGRMRTE